MSLRLLWEFYRASRGNVGATWREWKLRLALNAKSVFKSFQTLPEQYRLFSFKDKADFAPWLTSTDAMIQGTSLAEVELSRNKTMIFRGTVGTDPDGGFDPYGAAIVYCESFNPPLDLEGYDYLVWRMRELPPMDLVAEMSADDPRLEFMGRQDTRHDPEWSPYVSEAELLKQKYDRLQYLFAPDRSQAAVEAANSESQSADSKSTAQYTLPPLRSSLSVMSSMLSVPLPLSHAAHPFLKPAETRPKMSAQSSTSSIFKSLGATPSYESSTQEESEVDSSIAPPASPFDPNHPSHYWMFDGREVWLTVETDAKSGRSWLEKLAERLTSTSNQVDTMDGVKVHSHPVLLPAPDLLQRSGVREHNARMMSSPHARSMTLVKPDVASTTDSTVDSVADDQAKYFMAGEDAPLPKDGLAVPNRPFVNVLVPLRPMRRDSWPNVDSPSRPWHSLLEASPPRNSSGEPIWRSQLKYFEWSQDLNVNEVSRIGLAIPYTQPGPFAIEVESIQLVRGEVAEAVWPRSRPL